MVDNRALEAEKAADSGLRSRALSKYALREGQVEHKLSKAQVILGRGSGADLALAGPLVSRRHAELAYAEGGLLVTDLESRNGVFVNGRKIENSVLLRVGDTLAVGENAFVLVEFQDPAARRSATVSDVRAIRESDRIPVGTYTSDEVSVATRRADAFQLLGSVVDKALALGRGDEAEHLLGTHLVAALSDAATGRGVAPELARAAAQYAVKLATATGKAGWLDYTFRLYFALRAVMPLPIVDELYTVLRRVRGLDRELLSNYTVLLGAREDLSPPERFVLKRLEGLERLAAWHPAG